MNEVYIVSVARTPIAVSYTHLDVYKRQVNPFGIMAIACMTGMFSRQAIDKLREIFESMFRVNKDVREDKLTDNTNTTGE